MDYIKLGTRYYRDPALQAANDRTRGQAEVLFLRGLAQCGADETEGSVPRSSLVFLGVPKAEKVAAVLVEVGLWEIADDGWSYRSWDKWQSEHDALARRKKAERERQAKHRRKLKEEIESDPPEPPEPGTNNTGSRDRTQKTSRDKSRDVTPPRGEERKRRTDLGGDPASVDAGEHHEPAERTPAQYLAARYAAGVRLTDHGRALRVLVEALDAGYAPAMLEAAVDVLIAEQRACTLDTLRIALVSAPGNWGPAVGGATPAGPGNPYLDDMRARGTGTDSFRALFAVADPNTPPALEAR